MRCDRGRVAQMRCERGHVAFEGGDALRVEGGSVAQGGGLFSEVELERGEEAELVPICEEAFRGARASAELQWTKPPEGGPAAAHAARAPAPLYPWGGGF
jgi:hypothetical protein